jgi:hypothetical protein
VTAVVTSSTLPFAISPAGSQTTETFQQPPRAPAEHFAESGSYVAFVMRPFCG